MGEDEDLQVRSLAELALGEEIEAWHRGRLAHRGKVVSTLDGIDLFWIIDSRTGARRLLDLEQLSVRRLTPRTPRPAVGKPGPPPRKPAVAPAAGPAVAPVVPKTGASARSAAFLPAK
ncbi:hypothetical protein [Arthrobacter sp. D1-17]